MSARVRSHGLALPQAEGFPRAGVETVEYLPPTPTFNYLNANHQPGKPLLAQHDDEDTIRGDSDQDLESQRGPNYDTFGRREGSTSGSTGSSSSTRARINPRIVSDAILGLSDGLTVPFALSAGLSALGNTKVVVLGGLAELAAGALSMGLGGYVGAKSEA